MRPAADEDRFVQLCDLPWYKWAFVLSIGGFLSLFLILFQPFGVSNHDPDFRIDLAFLASMLGVGFAVSAALATSEFVLRPLLLPSPGRRQLLAWLAWDYALVGTVAFLYYNHLGSWHDLTWPSYFGFLRDLALVMSMPVIGFLLYVRHDALVSRFRHLVASADSPASPPPSRELVHFVADNEKDVFAVAAGQLLYLESQDNYLVVVHLEDGAPSSRLIRSSLKRVEAMKVPGLARCHRSYMVNLAQVRSCGGNQHGLKLYLPGVEQPIPASKAYARAILAAIGAPVSA